MPEAVNIFMGPDPLLLHLFAPKPDKKIPKHREIVFWCYSADLFCNTWTVNSMPWQAFTRMKRDPGAWKSSSRQLPVENEYFLLFGEVNYEILKVWLNALNGTSNFFNLLLTKHLFLRALQNLAFCSPEATIQISLITFTILFFLPYHDSSHLST